MVGGILMNQQEILNRYQKEKDEGKIFFNGKSLLKGYGLMTIVACFLMVMSFLLTGESTITDITFILIMPFLFCIYGMKAYYSKNKINILLSFLWFIFFIFKILDFISEYF